MKYQDRYVYPAVFGYADDGISIRFPDLPGCISFGDTDEEALDMAQEVLGLWMQLIEKEGECVPDASRLIDIPTAKNERAVLIDVWMPTVRKAIMNKAIKKTLTIPQWLDMEARRQDLNFSAILEKALKEELGIL